MLCKEYCGKVKNVMKCIQGLLGGKKYRVLSTEVTFKWKSRVH